MLLAWLAFANVDISLSAEVISAGTGVTEVYLPVVASESQAGGAGYTPADSGWLDYLNYYRSLAGLNAVLSNPDWNQGGWLHSRYMVKNDTIGHSEDQDNIWYSEQGDAAAKSSNLVVSYSGRMSDQEAIDAWMQGPFHNLGIIDPQLNSVGYGSYREEDGGLQMGAALDVLRGLGEVSQSVSYPVFWPRNGANITQTAFNFEYPDPLSSCSGYSPPAGIPIILQLGAGNETPAVTSHSFKTGNVALEHCVFDENTYSNSDANARALGRAILNMRDAIVLMPRHPLYPGNTYSVAITANGKKYSWSFSVSSPVSQASNFKE